MKMLPNFALYVIVPFMTFVILTFAFGLYAQSAHAAQYAYVDAAGDVKSVTANDWRSAIATAPNIHMHSGVLLLTTANDYDIVGDKVMVK